MQITLKTAHGRYLSAEKNTGHVVADRAEAGAWEKLQLERVDDTHVALKTAFGTYLTAEEGGGRELSCTRTTRGEWELWGYWIRDGKASLQAADGKWVRVGDGEEGFAVTATREGDPEGWETFDVAEIEAPEQPSQPRRTGSVEVHGRVWQDRQGPFFGVGATLFFGQWAMENDVARFDRFCRFFADRGVQYIRNLGQVEGGPWSAEGQWGHWQVRHMRWNNPRVFDVAIAATERAYNEFGLRTEWTIFGGGERLPNRQARLDFALRFIREVVVPRAHMIQHLELCNEGWQTYNLPRSNSGYYTSPEYVAEVRWIMPQLRAALNAAGLDRMGLASSSPPVSDPFEVGWAPIYDGLGCTLGTIHFDRAGGEDGWRPVRQPWDAQFCPGDLGHLAYTNNEPKGPGSSNGEENDPMKIAMAAVNTMLCGGTGYVYHCDAGIWSQPDRREYPEQHINGDRLPSDIAKAISLLPPDGAGWERQNHHWIGHHFADLGQQVYNTPGWTFTRCYGITRGAEQYCAPIHCRGTVKLRPKKDSFVRALHPLTGDVVQERELSSSQTMELPGEDRGGLSAYIVHSRIR